ncbi:hypothetical protein KIW84_057337, partial [Lathyrus oleraceus]
RVCEFQRAHILKVFDSQNNRSFHCCVLPLSISHTSSFCNAFAYSRKHCNRLEESLTLISMAMASFVVPGISSSQLCTQNQLKRASKWVFHGGVSVTSVKVMMHVVDHNQSQMGPGSGGDVSHGLHKDLCSLPRPLSITDIVSASDNLAKVRISYKDHTARTLHSKLTPIVKQSHAVILKKLLRLLSCGWLTKL